MGIQAFAPGCGGACRWATTGIWEMEVAGRHGAARTVAHHRTCLRCGASRLVPAVEGGGTAEAGSASAPAGAAGG